MIVAIDGPAGAGKSTVARQLAERLGFQYLDTGALYRTAVLIAQRRGCRPAEAAKDMHISLDGRVVVDGDDVTTEIRTPEITRLTAEAAKASDLRSALLGTQRDLLAQGDWVAEGRDIGSVVAPEAEVKIYLTASAEERARRRAVEQGLPYDLVLYEIKTRDEHDATRASSPLKPATGAEIIDTTGLRQDAVIEAIVSVVEDVERRTGSASRG